jgi:hypothetical protein
MISFGMVFLLMEIIFYSIPEGFYFISDYPASFALLIGYYLFGSLCGLLQGGLFGWFWGKENVKQPRQPLAVMTE